MIITKTLVIISALLLLAIFLLIRTETRRRGAVIIIDPMWQRAECIGDGACDWTSVPARYPSPSARIRHMPEAEAM